MGIIQGRTGEGETVGTTLRLPRDMRDKLKIDAIRNGRSMNTHAVMLLAAGMKAEEAKNATP